jgi:hypothetical protein
MNKKKIWIVTELFYPDETAVAYIFSRIANHLTHTYEVGIICGPEFYDINKISFVDKLDISGEIKIFRTNTFNLDKNSLLQRTIKILILSFRMGVLMWSKISKGEIVILSTNPAPILLLVRVIKYFKKFQLHVLVHDVFPENTIPANIFKSNRAIAFRLLKFFFDGAYAAADHLIVIGRDMKELMSAKLGLHKKLPRISIVQNWSNPNNYRFKTKVADSNNLVIQYSGNIGRVQGFIEILDAFRLSNNKKICFYIHGTGALYPYIDNYIKTFSIENIYLKGGYSRYEENYILEKCDIGIVSLSDGMFGLGVPSKTYNLLSAGKPILYIGEPNTEISLLVLENGIGWSLDIRNSRELIDFFQKINTIDNNTFQEMGEKARSLAENEYNELSVLRSFQSTIEALNN